MIPEKQDTALLLVDIQQDFCEGGALAVPDSNAVIPVANRLIDEALEKNWPVIASRDWHPREHCSFHAQGGPWPEHCVQDTTGAAFHPHLCLPHNAIIVSKGTAFDRDNYSAFNGTGLAHFLRSKGIHKLIVAGLAMDVCVEATLEEGRREGFEMVLIASGTRPVEPEKAQECREKLQRHGIEVAA